MRYASESSDVPNRPHLAVLLFDSVYVPGDERSRTHPGHGYPEHYERTVKYIVFRDEDELATWIDQHRNSVYTVLSVTPKTVTTQIKITLS